MSDISIGVLESDRLVPEAVWGAAPFHHMYGTDRSEQTAQVDRVYSILRNMGRDDWTTENDYSACFKTSVDVAH